MTHAQGTILLAEDDPNDVLLVERALTRAGFKGALRVVGDGDAAITYLAGDVRDPGRPGGPVPDLVLLDLKLPRRTGLDVLAWMRAEPVVRRIPVLVLTSSDMPADLERAYDLGANSYLVKPVAHTDLVALLTSVVHYWFEVNVGPRFVDGEQSGTAGRG
jgi:CheY-like chemotaxis protein